MKALLELILSFSFSLKKPVVISLNKLIGTYYISHLTFENSPHGKIIVLTLKEENYGKFI